MSEQSRSRIASIPSPADLGALLSAQGRLLGACARSGLILGEAARDCTARQVAIGQAAMRDLWTGAPAARPGAAVAWLGGLVREMSAELDAMRRTLLEAQLAVFEEMRRAVVGETPAGPPADRSETAAAPQAATAAEHASAADEPVAAVLEPASAQAEPVASDAEPVSAAAEEPAAAAGEPGEAQRPRRSRRAAPQA